MRAWRALSFLVLCAWPAAARADMSLIRTFVNGNTVKAHDLHIEYAMPGPITMDGFVSVTAGTPANKGKFEIKGKTLNVTFDPDIEPGASITIVAGTSGGSIAIDKWWWTDDTAQHNKLVRKLDEKGTTKDTYGPNERGDESNEQLAEIGKRPRDEDIYAIINKSHHFGGDGRFKNPVVITLDARPLLDAKKIPKGLDPDKVKAAVAAAIKQWTDCTSNPGAVPLAGEKGKPNANDGPGREPPVMAPGPTHKGGATGQKFRSVTKRECDAALFKYPKGLTINLLTDPKDKTTQAEITAGWGPLAGGTLGFGPSDPDAQDATKTGSGTITMTPTPPKKATWHVGEDTDKNGYITNEDTDTVGKTEYDFYSIFKHELGHVICFYHSGDNNFEMQEQPMAPAPTGEPVSTPSEERSPYHAAGGDSDTVEPGVIYFSSNRPGGFGGWDLWTATPTPDGWRVDNLGPQVNGPGDEVDPVLGSDGTSLFFSSNRPGGQGGFDIYRTAFDLPTQAWRAPANLGETVNSPADERHPTVRADLWTLYFASDRPGGFGGFDLYSAELVAGGQFSTAQNLGDQVNTAANEQAPAISGSGAALYFASDRPGGLGKLDLWKTVSDGGWSAPVNLGPGVNSADDDTDPSVRLDDGYFDFASNRAGGRGGFDLYQASLQLPDGGGATTPTEPKVENPWRARFVLQPVFATNLVSVGWTGSSPLPMTTFGPELRLGAKFDRLTVGGRVGFVFSGSVGGDSVNLVTVGGYVEPTVWRGHGVDIYLIGAFSIGGLFTSFSSGPESFTTQQLLGGLDVGSGVHAMLGRLFGLGFEVGLRNWFVRNGGDTSVSTSLYCGLVGTFAFGPPPNAPAPLKVP